MTLACSSRLQYLCSHFTTASVVAQRSPSRSHRTGTIVLTGKSQNPTTACTGPSNASICRCAASSSPGRSTDSPPASSPSDSTA